MSHTLTHNEHTQLDAQKRNKTDTIIQKKTQNYHILNHTIKNTQNGTETRCNPQPYEKTLFEKTSILLCVYVIYIYFLIDKQNIIYSIVCLRDIYIAL